MPPLNGSLHARHAFVLQNKGVGVSNKQHGDEYRAVLRTGTRFINLTSNRISSHSTCGTRASERGPQVRTGREGGEVRARLSAPASP